ncbi:MAG TPA: BTAD domain-containing putative transcriptional regulator, partial [Ilumatobacteraceae bacterium]
RAGDWAAVRRLANPSGEQQQTPSVAWISDLPPSIVADDPWLLLVRARSERLAGRWSEALASIHAAEARGIGTDFADECRAERSEITVWLDPLAPAPEGWIKHARAGCHRDPLAAAAALAADGGPEHLLVAAALQLAGGRARVAEELAERAINDDALGAVGISIGLTVLAIARLLGGSGSGDRTLDEAESYSERAGCGWVARIARAALALTDRPGGVDEALRVRDQCVADGDPWGAAIAGLLGGLGAARRGLPASHLFDDAAAQFQALEAATLRGLCIVADVAYTGEGEAAASAIARVGGIADVATLLGAFIAPDGGTTDSAPVGRPRDASPAQAAAPRRDATPAADAYPLQVRCFGPFEVLVDGEPINLDVVRPRVRALIKMLALHTEGAIHRETIVDALWPDGDAESGIHNLHVAASAIRKALSSAGLGDEWGVQRQGEAYRLVLPAIDACDLAAFRDIASLAKAAAARGDDDVAAEHATKALALYRGELLAEEGPLEWIVHQRSWASVLREAMTAIVAEAHLRGGRFRDVIEVCEATIIEHPYADELWRLLMTAHRERGDSAAAGRAQTRYENVLAEIAG